MWPVSPRWMDALRSSHRRQVSIVHRNLVTGVHTTLSGPDGCFLDGVVTVDRNAANRRTLSLTLAPLQSVFDLLDTPGGEITVTQSIVYVDGVVETVPLGVFIVDQSQIGYAPSGNIAVTAPDRWLKIARNRFTNNRTSVASNPAWAEIKRLAEEPWADPYPFPGWSQLDMSATTKVGSLVWDDGQRDNAINSIATTNIVEMFFDAQGFGVLRPTPSNSDLSPYVWTVDAGADGVMTDGNRTRDLSRTRNAILVTSSATDYTPNPVLVLDVDTSDPYFIRGPLGVVVYDYSSPLFRNATQMLNTGKTILRQQLGVAKQLTLNTSGNPALDAEDVILVVPPRTDANLPRETELHMIDAVTHPLNAASGQQQITTRSTRPDTDGT